MRETPHKFFPTIAEIRKALDSHSVVNGLVAVIFAITGPVAIILTVANECELSKSLIDGWIFSAFGIGGLLTIFLSCIYRQPLALAWTMPGAALLIPALDHVSFSEAVGAFIITGILMLALGFSGMASRFMDRVPSSVAMAMVAAVFLPFGLNLVFGIRDSPILGGIMVFGFVVAKALPKLGDIVPPILLALVLGVLVAILTSQGPNVPLAADWVIRPDLIAPRFSFAAITELVLPLTISVIAVQNLQGFSVLKATGYKVPINVLTIACGYGTLAMGVLGSVPTCVTGPANAILVSTGKLGHHYAGAIVFGSIFFVVGLLAPLTTQIATTMPPTFIKVLGGLAMLSVILSALQAAFKDPSGQMNDKFGPLAAFVVTLSGITIFNIGSPFWGLVAGYLVHLILDKSRKDVG